MLQCTRITNEKFVKRERVFGKKYIYDLWWWICLTNNPADILIKPFGKAVTLVAAGKCFELIWKGKGKGTERFSNCTL